MTEEEIALKKSEIARRRKHQSIQRAEQDKVGLYLEIVSQIKYLIYVYVY